MSLLNGEMSMLKFTLAVREKGGKQERERIDYVPCIIYNPTDKVQGLLSEGLEVELQGKVRTFSFEFTGERIYRTEVIVNQRSLQNID